MSTDRSYANTEIDVDHVLTDSGDCHTSPNFKRQDNPMEIEEEVHMKPSDHSLSTRRKVWFIIIFSGFVILYVIFFLAIAYTYPLKPEVYVEQLYLPVFDKISPNITQEMKDSAALQLRFNNRNKLISASYNDFLNITIYYYLPNSTTSIHFANATLPGFSQHKAKPATAVVWIIAPGLPGLIKRQGEFTTMLFHVNLEFNMSFHCRELGKHKHQFFMTAEFEVLLASGSSFQHDIQMYE